MYIHHDEHVHDKYAAEKLNFATNPKGVVIQNWSRHFHFIFTEEIRLNILCFNVYLAID